MTKFCQFLLRLIIGTQLPNNLSPARLVCAICSLLDFLYLAQYPVHSSKTLYTLDKVLQSFHANKDIFIILGIHENFLLPKLHSLAHYHHFIELFGTTDNYNTEYMECLHINLTKDTYRSTNHKDEYPQMTLWLERKEKIHRHEKLIHQQIAPPVEPLVDFHQPPSLICPHKHQMTKHPTAKVTLQSVTIDYDATFFEAALSCFVVQYQRPHDVLPVAQLETAAGDIMIPFQKVLVFHRIKYTENDRYSITEPHLIVDSVHAQPS